MAATALNINNRVHAATTAACAKINLTLDVLGARRDGYHELRSVVIGIGLYDRLRCTRRAQTGIALKCSDSGLEYPQNLALRAAEALATSGGVESGLLIELDKAIPTGGGLGGGSSDAASTLRLCNHLWGLSYDRDTLAEIGAGIGSDVPLFFSLPSAVITGRGEQVAPLTLKWSGWVLLVHARRFVATPHVYQAWRPADRCSRSPADWEEIAAAGTARALSPLLFNDLEPAVGRVCPFLAELSDRLDGLGVGPMRISGAGSTLYRLFDDEEAARAAARLIECQEVDATTMVVAGPVDGSPIHEQGV